MKKAKYIIFIAAATLLLGACANSSLPDLREYDYDNPAATPTPTTTSTGGISHDDPPPGTGGYNDTNTSYSDDGSSSGARQIYHIPASTVSWGELTSFSMGWGDFHGGHQFFSIEKIDGEFIFNASGEMGIQIFVPENLPVPDYEAEAILTILKEYGADRFDGYSSGWCGYCTGDFSLSLTVAMDTGDTINTHVGCYSPVGFGQLLSALSSFLHDMAQRHKAQPQWGNLTHLSFTPPSGSAFNVREDWRGVHFRRGFGDNAVEGLFEPYVMEELFALLVEYDIIGWWSDVRGREETRPQNAQSVEVFIRFDNDTGFYATRWVSPPVAGKTQRADVNALLSFFEDLENRAIQAMPVIPDPTSAILTISSMPPERYLDFIYNATEIAEVTNEARYVVEVGDVINIDAFSTITILEINPDTVFARFRSDGAILTFDFAGANNRSSAQFRFRYESPFMLFGIPLDEPPTLEMLENIEESDMLIWTLVFSRDD